jgi:hypothetical protein
MENLRIKCGNNKIRTKNLRGLVYNLHSQYKVQKTTLYFY